MTSLFRLLVGSSFLLFLFVLFRCNALPRSQAPAENTYRRAIVRLPFHKYYREIGYTVDAEGHAVYQGDIDLGPVNDLLPIVEANRIGFRNGDLPNGLVKLRADTRFTAIRQAQIDNPQPPGFPKSSINLDPELKWPGGVVPYEIHRSIDAADTIALILGAMDFLEDSTNVRFVPRGNHSNYIRFVSCPNCNGAGSSPIGMQGGRQKIRLRMGVASQGNIVHEIMHSLGVYHTQSRADRDSFVCINLNNVIEGTEFNFDRHDGEDYAGVYGAYNVNSVMHYSSCSFSNGTCSQFNPVTPTVLGRNPDGSCNPAFIGGQRLLAGIPPGDFDAINYMYGPSLGGLGTTVPSTQTRTLTVYLQRLTTLIGPEENGLGCNNEMDFYATVELGPLADITEDPYAFSRSEVFNYSKREGNDIWPGWTANIALQSGERYGLIRITVRDDDKDGPAGVGACGGADDVVDVSPFSNMRILHLVVDTQTNEVHLSRTVASVPQGQTASSGNLTFSSTLNGRLGYISQGLVTAGNTTGESHSARVQVMVALE